MEYPSHLAKDILLRGGHKGERARLRPARSSDIDGIVSYLKRMSDEERRLRYMGRFSIDALIDPERLARRYHDTLDYENHMAFIVCSTMGEIIGVSHAHAIKWYERGRFEVSYSRDASCRGAGVGTALMEALFSWRYHNPNVVGFFGDTLRENERMRKLFELFGFSPVYPHPEGDPLAVRYRVDFRTY